MLFSCNVKKWLSFNTISLNIFDRVPVGSKGKKQYSRISYKKVFFLTPRIPHLYRKVGFAGVFVGLPIHYVNISVSMKSFQ